MSKLTAQEFWGNFLEILHEKLQYSIIDQSKSVVDVEVEGNELSLKVDSEEALSFFQAEVNQQRIMILSRPLLKIEGISVSLVSPQ